MKQAVLYTKLEGKKVQCRACNHYCMIAEGKTGICGVRKNAGGELYLLVYGRPIASHIDPIEKKPLFHFLPGSKIFSIGTVGCNFGCLFCQNFDISQSLKEGNLNVVGEDLPPEQIVEYCKKNKIPSIAYTYNEPTIFFEYAYDTAMLAKKSGIRNVFVTNGYMSKEALKKLEECADALNIDLKGFTEEFYSKSCKARLEPVLENIRQAKKTGLWVEITTLLIQGLNDSDDELVKIAEFIANIDKEMPWHISAFHPDYKMTGIPPTSHESLLRAYAIGKKAGLKHVYLGNVRDAEHESTFCPKCNKPVIRRNGYFIEKHKIKNGKCSYCDSPIKGVWD